MIRVSIRMPTKLNDAIKSYMHDNPGIMKESEAIRRLLQKGLEAEGVNI